MADEMTKVVKEFVKLLNERDRKAVKPYDTPAKVVRVDGNTAWVHIPGGVDETPVARTTNAMPGDNVQVRISGGRAWLTGNATNPPTDDTRANVAYSYAGVAQETAVGAQDTADEAIDIATNAEADAKRAHDAADAAELSAKQAKDDAEVAHKAADQATLNLSYVEDVVGVMNWVSDHGSFIKTTDTAIQEGKIYFVLIDGDYVPVVSPKTEDLSTYYELSLTEAMQDYLTSHLALTARGLWILPSGFGASSDAQTAPGYKALMSAGSSTQQAGMFFYDDLGNVVSAYRIDGVQVGRENESHLNVSGTSLEYCNRYYTPYKYKTTEMRTLTFQDASSSVTVPFYGGNDDDSDFSDTDVITLHIFTDDPIITNSSSPNQKDMRFTMHNPGNFQRATLMGGSSYNGAYIQVNGFHGVDRSGNLYCQLVFTVYGVEFPFSFKYSIDYPSAATTEAEKYNYSNVFDIEIKNDQSTNKAEVVDVFDPWMEFFDYIIDGETDTIGFPLRYSDASAGDNFSVIFNNGADTTSIFTIQKVIPNGKVGTTEKRYASEARFGWYAVTSETALDNTDVYDSEGMVAAISMQVRYSTTQSVVSMTYGKNDMNLAADQTVMIGENNTAGGIGSIVGGKESISKMNAERSFTWGEGLVNYEPGSVLLGKYNALNATDGEVFTIGGGTSDNNRKNVFSVNGDGALRALNFYPVGSIYESSTNVNPEETLGFGSWTLIDKEFIYKVFTSGGITWNTAACTDGSYVCLRKNHEIWFRVTWKNKIAYEDRDIKLFELNPKTFGLNVKPYYEAIIPGVSDALGAYLVAAGRNESDTKFEVWLYETVYKNGAASSQTGVSCSVEFNWHFGYSAMADSTCKSFKWRRDS